MIKRGYDADSQTLLQQIEGFADYGFPESHSASFALIVYVSAWLSATTRRLRLRAAEQPADGLLRAGADHRRRAGTARRGAACGC